MTQECGELLSQAATEPLTWLQSVREGWGLVLLLPYTDPTSELVQCLICFFSVCLLSLYLVSPTYPWLSTSNSSSSI